MKLGKTLIVTGLLFSSVLGSVNVNNITAMADTVRTESEEQEEVEAPEKVNVSLKYDFNDNDAINVDEFTKVAEKTVEVNSDDETYDLSNLKMPDGYEVIFKKPVTITADSNGSRSIVVAVRRISTEVAVSAKYYDKDGKVISDEDVVKGNLPMKLTLKDSSKPVDKDNLKNIPDKFEFVKYENEIVILKETVESTVTKPTVKPDTKPTVSNKKPLKVSGPRRYVAQRVRISFIDQDGDEVGYKQLNGKDTFSAKIETPKGYSFVNAKDAAIKFDRSGNKNLKLKVTRDTPTSVKEEGIVTTNSGSYKHLFTIQGKEISNRGLSGDSKWYTDQYATINGEKMFRVATNEWVKATDVYK